MKYICASTGTTAEVRQPPTEQEGALWIICPRRGSCKDHRKRVYNRVMKRKPTQLEDKQGLHGGSLWLRLRLPMQRVWV